jgi:hypothetical protein
LSSSLEAKFSLEALRTSVSFVPWRGFGSPKQDHAKAARSYSSRGEFWQAVLFMEDPGGYKFYHLQTFRLYHYLTAFTGSSLAVFTRAHHIEDR